MNSMAVFHTSLGLVLRRTYVEQTQGSWLGLEEVIGLRVEGFFDLVFRGGSSKFCVPCLGTMK